eukprot:gene12388-biopygen3040
MMRAFLLSRGGLAMRTLSEPSVLRRIGGDRRGGEVQSPRATVADTSYTTRFTGVGLLGSGQRGSYE